MESKVVKSRSFFGKAGISAIIGSGVESGARQKQANILEVGGTIRPKNSKFLAIPLAAALTKAGNPRKGKTSPRDWPRWDKKKKKGTFVMRSRAGNLLIMNKPSKKKPAVPLYVLKKKVKIPPFNYLAKTIESATPSVLRIIRDGIKELKL